MAGITLEMAEARLTAYLALEEQILLAGQAFEADGTKLTRANLADVQAAIKLWDQRARELDPDSGAFVFEEIIPTY